MTKSIHTLRPLWVAYRSIPRVSPATLLNNFKINDTPVPIEKIVRQLGIEIQMSNSDDFAGASETRNHTAVIQLRARDARVRQRFTLAHELCHVLWHPLGQNFRDADFKPSTPLELEANGFAAELLMPEWMLRSAVASLGHEPLQLAAMFDVSVASMEYRQRQFEQQGISP